MHVHDVKMKHNDDDHDPDYVIGIFRPEQGAALRPRPQPEVDNSETQPTQNDGKVSEYKLYPIMTVSQWPIFVAGRVSQCLDK